MENPGSTKSKNDEGDVSTAQVSQVVAVHALTCIHTYMRTCVNACLPVYLTPTQRTYTSEFVRHKGAQKQLRLNHFPRRYLQQSNVCPLAHVLITFTNVNIIIIKTQFPTYLDLASKCETSTYPEPTSRAVGVDDPEPLPWQVLHLTPSQPGTDPGTGSDNDRDT